MKNCIILVITLHFFITKIVVAQVNHISSHSVNPESGIISGKIVDVQTMQAIGGCHVFLHETSIATVTQEDGAFTLVNARSNTIYELVVSVPAYEILSVRVSPIKGELKLGSLLLKKKTTRLKIPDPLDLDRSKNLKLFKKVFLGSDKGTKCCEILNPEVINLNVHHDTLIAETSSPILILNKNLGYTVFYYLKDFFVHKEDYLLQGYNHFESLQSPNEKVVGQWVQKREQAYNRSLQCLFKSFIDQHVFGNGFELYSMKSDAKKEPASSLYFEESLGKSILPYDTNAIIFTTPQKDIFRLVLKGKVEIHYIKEKAYSKIYNDVPFLISWISLKKDFILINKEGIPLNSSDVIVSGDMGINQISHLMPIDFKPSARFYIEKDQEKLQDLAPYIFEKFYIHTDKSYYYPGETIWYKGYINYSTPSFRDSLSGTAYVEFIHGATQEVICSKIIRIDSGVFDGDFILRDSLKPSDYFIRAYTSLNRNYGDNNLYTKYIPVLDAFEKPIVEQTAYPNNTQLIITADKTSYATRSKITLTIQVKDHQNNPMGANMSIAVTDLSQVHPLTTSSTIVDAYPIKEIPHARLSTARPLEFGLNFKVKIKNDNNRIERGTVNVYQLNPQDFFVAETNELGILALKDLFFYDSTQFTFQLVKENKLFYRRGELIPRNIPFFSNQVEGRNFKTIKTNSPQRDKTTFEIPDDARLLNEITVRASKIEDNPKLRPYGKPDYILEAKDLNTSYGNLLLTLPGKIPGLIVRQANISDEGTRWVVYTQRGASSSIANAKEVLVLVNDVVMGGNPADVLAALDPSSIESVELKSSVSSLLGSAGSSGVLYIYTKQAKGYGDEQNVVPHLTIPGYTRPRRFIAPLYEDNSSNTEITDLRSLLYWNPNISTNKKISGTIVSFYSSDLKGQYRVVVEGITDNNNPIRGEITISVNK